jgi:hypothetical protein
MNKIFFLLSLLFIVAACQKKAVPVITERKYEPPKRVVTTFPTPGTIAPDTSIGKTVFINRCGKCHGLPEPVQFTAERWDGILISMMPKARLNEEQKIHITAYIKSHASN